jgi:CheY-like chemotaxis protein
MQTTSARPTGLRVLVVEDDPDAAGMLLLLLRLWGHDCEAVHTGAAALEALRTAPPDVALVDIGLPGLNGYQLAERVRDLGLGPRTVLVAMTGLGDEEHRRRSREAGFREHLVKPVDPPRLQELLQELTRERDRKPSAVPAPEARSRPPAG